MEFWNTTPYKKWYRSHRRFSFTAKFCIELYEEKKRIPLQIFQPFLRSLLCHSKSEEKMFAHIDQIKEIFKEHILIDSSKTYTDQEKYSLCKSLLLHMHQEEEAVKEFLIK